MSKKRGYMTKKERPKGGRAPLKQGGRIVQVGVKMPEELEAQIIETSKMLRKYGYAYSKTSKAAILRILTEYMLDCALDTYAELFPGEANE